MKKIIVTTTINPPTEAVEKFDAIPDWHLIVIGDVKTPHNYRLKRGEYWDIDKQFDKYPDLSNAIGLNTISRRNIGFVEAYNQGADIIAVIDDDNIPYDYWGKNLSIGRKIDARCYYCKDVVFDPLSVTHHYHLWHRGFPIQLVNGRSYSMSKTITISPLVQADLWDGDPDIDAVCRMIYKPEIKFSIKEFYTSNKISPFNSQNTFVHKSVIPYYCMLTGIGRMDDIWASYILQTIMSCPVVYGPASVYQKRNKHDLTKDMINEFLGYEKSLSFINDLKYLSLPALFNKYMPYSAAKVWDAYRKEFTKESV